MLFGIGSPPNEPQVSTAYKVSVNDPDRQAGLSWYKDDINWCKPRFWLIHIRIDEGGVIRLNQEVNGSLWNLEPFERRLDEIMSGRAEYGAVFEIYDDRADFLGTKWVLGEFRISAPAGMKCGDLIRIVDFVNSYGVSSVIIEPAV